VSDLECNFVQIEFKSLCWKKVLLERSPRTIVGKSESRISWDVFLGQRQTCSFVTRNCSLVPNDYMLERRNLIVHCKWNWRLLWDMVHRISSGSGNLCVTLVGYDLQFLQQKNDLFLGVSWLNILFSIANSFCPFFIYLTSFTLLASQPWLIIGQYFVFWWHKNNSRTIPAVMFLTINSFTTF
jgi:hypothetical protein